MKIGLDLGTTAIKSAMWGNGNWQTVLVDSVVATGKESEHGNFGLFKKSQAIDCDVLEHLGVTNFVGAGAIGKRNPRQPIAQSRFFSGDLLLKLILTTVGKFNPERGQAVKLNLSLPVSVIDQYGYETLQSGISQWLMGSHRFYLNGKSNEIEVIKIQLNNQPIHAYLGLTHDIEGNWIHPSLTDQKKVIMFDLGGGTFDITTVGVGLEIDDNLTDGGEYGFYQAATELEKLLKPRIKGFNKSIYELSSMIRQFGEGKPVTILIDKPKSNESVSHSRGLATQVDNLISYDISELCAESYNAMIDQAIEFARRTVPKEQATGCVVIFIGGPANLQSLTKRFKTEYPNMLVESNRHLASIGAAVELEMSESE